VAHFAIVCPEDGGHLLSLGPLGKELVRRGHRVTVVAGDRAAPVATRLDLPLHELSGGEDISCPAPLLLRLACGLSGMDWLVQMRGWYRWHSEATLRYVPPALKELAVDAVLVDHVASAGGTAAQRAGVPFITVCTALPWLEEPGVPPPHTARPYAEGRRAEFGNRLSYAGFHWFVRPALGVINRYRAAWNLPQFSGIDDALSPLAQISQLCPELDFPRRRLPDTFHYIGSLAANRQVNTDHQFPWDRLDGRPLIFASLGTVSDSTNLPVFRRILAACDGLDAQLVMALGRSGDQDASVREELGEIPPNAIVVDFAPQLALLDRAALLITHAGVNTVLESLSRAVPMVALPRSADQLGMGARVAHTAVGLVGSFARATPSQIRDMVQRVLAEDAFRRRAKELQRAMLAAGGASRAADIAEEVLSTRRPVTRR
jgi:zeaxanthin glucosyltransferase